MSRIIRKRTEIHGYLGIYSCESCAKPSYMVEILKKRIFGQPKLIHKYYIVSSIYRTIGVMETKHGPCSTQKMYGDVVGIGYTYMENLEDGSLKRMHHKLYE